MTQDIYQARIQAVLQIRLDGAELWDVAAFIAEKHQAGDEPWKGETPLSPQQIESIVKAADALIAQANPELPPDVARHIAMRKNLYARAVQAGEIATAARILKDIAQLEQVYPAKGERAPATTGELKRLLLLEIQLRHLRIADETAPDVVQFEYGPLWSAVQWFDCADDDAQRMRWNRTMAALIGEGLVVENREDGCRWPNVKLTPAGEKEMEEGAGE